MVPVLAGVAVGLPEYSDAFWKQSRWTPWCADVWEQMDAIKVDVVAALHAPQGHVFFAQRSGEKWFYNRKKNSTIVQWLDAEDKILTELVVTEGANVFRVLADSAGHALFSPWTSPADRVFFGMALARHQGCIIHGASAVVNGRLFLFSGESGRGKSTLAMLLEQSKMFQVLGDERCAVRLQGKHFTGHGTPWQSSVDLSRPGSAPLGCLVFIGHGRENVLDRISAAEALQLLLPEVDLLWAGSSFSDAIYATLDQLLTAVPCYRFDFLPDQSAVSMLESAFA